MTTPANPFVKYRDHLDVYRFALGQGMSDGGFVELVENLDAKVAQVWGTGFVETPLVNLDLGDRFPTDVVAKVETANVSGSHKARHLFGLMIHNMVLESTSGVGAGSLNQPDLAIASCGNAALGAAVVAAAAERRLIVFVPDDANQLIVSKLQQLGAEVEHCQRQVGVVGDPCLHRLEQSVDHGAQPFSVQGPICPESIDGGRTLGLELAEQLDTQQIWVDHAWIQVGGGALASSVMDGLARACPDRRLPRLHPVQAQAAHPYVAGWRRIAPELWGQPIKFGDESSNPEAWRQFADQLQIHTSDLDLAAVLDQRADLMVPWPTTPTSVASGILDDLAYDWRTVMVHQIKTGGWPVTASEADFERALDVGKAQVDPAPDATGTSGLAGIFTLKFNDSLIGNERHLVLITGGDRTHLG